MTCISLDGRHNFPAKTVGRWTQLSPCRRCRAHPGIADIRSAAGHPPPEPTKPADLLLIPPALILWGVVIVLRWWHAREGSHA